MMMRLVATTTGEGTSQVLLETVEKAARMGLPVRG